MTLSVCLQLLVLQFLQLLVTLLTIIFIIVISLCALLFIANCCLPAIIGHPSYNNHHHCRLLAIILCALLFIAKKNCLQLLVTLLTIIFIIVVCLPLYFVHNCSLWIVKKSCLPAIIGHPSYNNLHHCRLFAIAISLCALLFIAKKKLSACNYSWHWKSSSSLSSA